MEPSDAVPQGAATVQLSTSATRAQVWEVLADGFRYPGWVVGASHMRAVDETWPAPGARLHHAAGVWPLLVQDVTEVEASQEPDSLVLLAKGRPFGEARVVIELEDDGAGSTITMSEDAVSPLVRSLVPEVVRRKFLEARNTESLRRLVALAERRSDPDEPQDAG